MSRNIEYKFAVKGAVEGLVVAVVCCDAVARRAAVGWRGVRKEEGRWGDGRRRERQGKEGGGRRGGGDEGVGKGWRWGPSLVKGDVGGGSESPQWRRGGGEEGRRGQALVVAVSG